VITNTFSRLFFGIALTALCSLILLGCAEKPKITPKVQDVTEQTADEKIPAAAALSPWEAPAGLPKLPVPADNPITTEKVALGKLLFFDKRLSKDGTISCATCHIPKVGWAESTPVSTGIGEQIGPVNAPSVINTAYPTTLFWDGRVASLEEQALGPIENPIEMGHKLEDLVPELNKIDGYKELFQKVFGEDVTKDGIAKAIAAFERTVLSGNSAYDKYIAGDQSAMTADQIKGWELFQERNCVKCHVPPLFSNHKFYNAGVDYEPANLEAGNKPHPGLADFSKNEKDAGKFRTPMLRDIVDTKPYTHSGKYETLDDIILVMLQGGIKNAGRSRILAANVALFEDDPNKEETVKNIKAFLGALSGDYPKVEEPTEFPK